MALRFTVISSLAKALLSEDKQLPEAAAAEASPESRKAAETIAFRQIPTEIPAKPVPVSVASVPRVVIPPPAVPPASVPVPSASRVAVHPVNVCPSECFAVVPTVRPVAKIVQPPPAVVLPPVAKKLISRADMATIFDNGKRTLTRTAAVAALKRLGFGKTAAYFRDSTRRTVFRMVGFCVRWNYLLGGKGAKP